MNTLSLVLYFVVPFLQNPAPPPEHIYAKLYVGMPKAELIRSWGDPYSVDPGREIGGQHLFYSGKMCMWQEDKLCLVVLVNGKVTSSHQVKGALVEDPQNVMQEQRKYGSGT
jgi:hypothetical protein